MLWWEDFKKYNLLCWEEGDFFWGEGWLFAVGESWDGEEEGEIGDERVAGEGIY